MITPEFIDAEAKAAFKGSRAKDEAIDYTSLHFDANIAERRFHLRHVVPDTPTLAAEQPMRIVFMAAFWKYATEAVSK